MNDEPEDELGYDLDLIDIKNLYCYNRHNDINMDYVDTLAILMYMGGSLPTVKTSYKINTEFLKTQKKFK